MQRVIFHIDVNSAFLSWEAVYRMSRLGETEDLRQMTAAVGGDMAKRRGVILAKSASAKSFGVRTGESIVEAMRKCPQLLIIPPRYEWYRESSAAFMKILREYSPDVEQYSIDEAFVDMTGMEALFGEPVTAANRIRERIFRELGFTVNVGISANKLLAKMASDFEKPNKVHTLFPEEIRGKMWPLPVSELLFVGDATERKLHSLGIRTIGQLACSDPQMIRQHLKKHGETIWKFANGVDVSLVETEPGENKGYSSSTTIAFDVTDEGTAKMVLLGLAEQVAGRLRRDGKRAETIAVSVKDKDFHQVSHQTAPETPTDITEEIYLLSCRLFDELWDGSPIRHLGLYASRVCQKEDTVRQLSMFDTTDYEKLEKMDQAVDQIRKKFGKNSVMRASFLETPADHMHDRREE